MAAAAEGGQGAPPSFRPHLCAATTRARERLPARRVGRAGPVVTSAPHLARGRDLGASALRLSRREGRRAAPSFAASPPASEGWGARPGRRRPPSFSSSSPPRRRGRWGPGRRPLRGPASCASSPVRAAPPLREEWRDGGRAGGGTGLCCWVLRLPCPAGRQRRARGTPCGCCRRCVAPGRRERPHHLLAWPPRPAQGGLRGGACLSAPRAPPPQPRWLPACLPPGRAPAPPAAATGRAKAWKGRERGGRRRGRGGAPLLAGGGSRTGLVDPTGAQRPRAATPSKRSRAVGVLQATSRGVRVQ